MDSNFDPGSGANGYVINGTIYSVVVQADGKVVIGGWFDSVNGVSRNKIARLNADGNLDTGFDPGTGPNGDVRAVAIQPDGKVVIRGDFSNVNGVSRSKIARLNADGSLDTGFYPDLGASGSVSSIALQADGKVLIGGSFTSVNGAVRNRTARLYADGSLDTSFEPGTGANDTVLSVAIQPDGKVLIRGDFSRVNGVSRSRIARLNANGSLDTSFDLGTGAGGWVKSIAVQADSKVLENPESVKVVSKVVTPLFLNPARNGSLR